MKILKRIIYALLGLLIAGTIALVGIILYAEYSGNHFTPDSVPSLAQWKLSNDESRLAYDDNGNLIELPQTSGDTAGHSGNTETAPEENTADSPETPSAAPAEDTAAGSNAASSAPAASLPYSPSSTDGEPELPYVMDLGSALFHTPDCPYAANIAADKRSEMTTASSKIINAGYKPCPNCHPDTVSAAAANAAGSSDAEVSN